MASIVPSPPSPTGKHKHSTLGTALSSPRLIVFATSPADRLSLKESGAITIFINFTFLLKEINQVQYFY